MSTEIDQDCADQNQNEWDACIGGCMFSGETSGLCDDQFSFACYETCVLNGGCGPEPNPEDCQVDVTVDPVAGECASYDSVKNCLRNLSGGLETLTLEMTVACNATLGSKWQCEPCKPQSLNADRLGQRTLFCPRSPDDMWVEDCISQTDGDVLSRP